MQFQNAYLDETIDSIGFRLRGNTSRNAAKKSFKIDFNHLKLIVLRMDMERLQR